MMNYSVMYIKCDTFEILYILTYLLTYPYILTKTIYITSGIAMPSDIFTNYI